MVLMSLSSVMCLLSLWRYLHLSDYISLTCHSRKVLILHVFFKTQYFILGLGNFGETSNSKLALKA